MTLDKMNDDIFLPKVANTPGPQIDEPKKASLYDENPSDQEYEYSSSSEESLEENFENEGAIK